MSASVGSSAKRKAPEADTTAAASRATRRSYGDEFMDMNVDVEPDWDAPPATVASDRGAGNLGFAGTAHKEAVAEAAGLTTLADDEFGGGPRMPMVPGTWDPDDAGETGGHGPSA